MCVNEIMYYFDLDCTCIYNWIQDNEPLKERKVMQEVSKNEEKKRYRFVTEFVDFRATTSVTN